MKTVSLSEAKESLGRLVDEAARGETILITKKSKLFALQEFQIPQPIPIRPPGYFDDSDTPEDIRLHKKLASKAPRKILP